LTPVFKNKKANHRHKNALFADIVLLKPV